MAIKGGLGKGLGALLDENLTEGAAPITVRIAQIEPNRDQPRKTFDEKSLNDLADSIRRYGLLQPLLVRPLPLGGYQLVAGERRWRAARLAGLADVPVVVKELSDGDAAEIALVENLQREDLNPVEEAMGYRTLMNEYGLTQDEVAAHVGRSRSAVANAVRLLSLPPDLLALVEQGKISAGHGRALLRFTDADAREKAARAATFGANVRQIERMAQKAAEPSAAAQKSAVDPFYKEAELALRESLGRRVKVRKKGKGGVLEIEFYNSDDLKTIALKLE